MKRKCLAPFLAACMLLSACGGTPAAEPPTGVYYEITGVDPAETVLVLDGNEIPAELYCYWVAFNCSAVEYQVKMYHDRYGMYEELFREDGTIDWNANFPNSDLTLNEYAENMVKETVFFYAAIENLAEKYGVKLSEKDKVDIEEELQSMEESLGGPEAFEQYLQETGLSLDNLQRVMAATNLLDGLTGLVDQPDSELYLPQEDYGKYLYYTDYIALSLTDDMSETEKTEVRSTAQELLTQLEKAEDQETLFSELAKEHSQESSQSEGQRGYFYAPGVMPEVFEAAAQTLSPGELSGLIESEHAVYILLGKDLEQGLSAYPEQKEALFQSHVIDLLNAYQDEMKVERRGDLTDMVMGDFYEKYLEKMEQIAVEDTVDTLQKVQESAAPQK